MMPPAEGALPSIGRRTVLSLGVSQLVCWGTSYYVVAVFGDAIAAALGWSRSVVHGGFSVALLVMALSSRATGALIDRHGGRRVMAAGSVLIALGCAGLAIAHGVAAYLAAWACLGLAMRLTLYDAAFAALARLGGLGAKGPIAQVTLLGGLASTTFWPIGHALAERVGWRGALLAYAGMALLTLPLHLAIPAGRADRAASGGGAPVRAPLAEGPRERWIAGGLYALVLTLVAFLNAAMSAHMIGLLAASGLTAAAAVWVAALRGVGQSLGRLAEILSGSRLHPLLLNVLAALVLPASFALGLWSGGVVLAAAGFAFLYGAGNGISTIARGTLPLVLFDHRTYGAVVGRLLVPSYVASAVAPFAYGLLIDRSGQAAAMHLSIAASVAALAAALALEVKFGPRRRRPAGRNGR
jgi:MFS family permease